MQLDGFRTENAVEINDGMNLVRDIQFLEEDKSEVLQHTTLRQRSYLGGEEVQTLNKRFRNVSTSGLLPSEITDSDRVKGGILFPESRCRGRKHENRSFGGWRMRQEESIQ
ncbi:hypothetical protein R3P38DRAFT_2788272 [Favolaschia claudopus]|uniref:Uncharacterized protein n=1 Tax=Favolaschia claudopus TaxID=2862362 RepID=A0AAW0ALV9_9AGAR